MTLLQIIRDAPKNTNEELSELVFGKILSHVTTNCISNNKHDINELKYACNCWDSVAKNEENPLVVGGLREFFLKHSPELIELGL